MHIEPTGAWWLLGVCAALVVAFLLTAHSTKLKKNVSLFYCWLGAIAVLGGAAAFFLPIAVNSGFNKDDDGSALRQALLYTTGGLLGVITLGETHRKNNQEKEKNENDHTRQVYAERRSRYTKAVEQLANEKAAVRLGGIYTLVGLVDEWLTDDTLDPEERQKEGQVIINNLCSYIRSPFPLAEEIEEYKAYKELEKLQKSESERLSEEESSRLQILLKRFKDADEYEKPKDITADYAKFHEEQDVRHTIFAEMSKRSSTFTKNEMGKIIETIPGTWSKFDFDFSRAPIFYPLNNLTIEKANFSSASFYDSVVFSQTSFAQQANFRKANFIQNATFREANFIQNATFREANFLQNATFREANFLQNATFNEAMIHKASFDGTVFTQNASFSEVTFTSNAYFSKAAFTQKAYFSKSNFIQNADFSEATFAQNATFNEATFTQHANFDGVTFAQKGTFYTANFTRNANFSRATFAQNANFSKGVFTQNADFSEAIFTQSANFSEATFVQNAYFHKAIFTQDAYFSQASFKQKAYFHKVTFIQDAHFSRVVFTQDVTFSKATFARNVAFRETIFVQNTAFSRANFAQNTNFSRATFAQNTTFLRTIFTQNANFQGAYFKNIEPVFAKRNSGSFFSVLTDPSNYVFTVNSDSSESITTEQVTIADGRVFTIPVGCELFDPEPLPAPKPKEPTK